MPDHVEDQIPHRVCLGKIATAHGLRGLVKIHLYGDDPHLLDCHGPLYTSETGNTTLSLTMKNSMGKYWLAEVENVKDRDKAEGLRGTELWLDRNKLPEPGDGEFYYEDLVGLDVINAEDCTKIGSVISVQNFGAGDLLEIKPISGQSFYLPFTESQYILSTDLEKGEIVVEIPEGLR